MTLTCRACGMQWAHVVVSGPLPHRCPQCKQHRPAGRGFYNRAHASANPDLASRATAYRLAIEAATAALRLGRPADALHALAAVQAPTR